MSRWEPGTERDVFMFYLLERSDEGIASLVRWPDGWALRSYALDKPRVIVATADKSPDEAKRVAQQTIAVWLREIAEDICREDPTQGGHSEETP